MNHNNQNNEETYNNDDHPLSMNNLQKYKSYYLKVSNHAFKQILSNAIKDVDKIV